MPRSVLILAFLALVMAVSADDTVDREVINISTEPRLHLVKNFASDEEMDYIMKNAFENMKPQNYKAETGMVYELPVHSSPLLTGVHKRMSSIFPGVSTPKNPEEAYHDTFRVRRYLADGVGYAGGDYHPPHTDWFSSIPGDTSHVLIISMILYLTSPEEGGTTYFEHAWVNGTKGYHFQPKRGDLAAWWSCYRNGTQDFTSSHESTPLKQGIKWNAARFFYDNVNKCSTPAATTIKVPAAANNLKDMGPSSEAMFGSSFPKGVWADKEGTQMEGQSEDGDMERYKSIQAMKDAEDAAHLARGTAAKEVDMENTEEAIQLASVNPKEVATKRMIALASEVPRRGEL